MLSSCLLHRQSIKHYIKCLIVSIVLVFCRRKTFIMRLCLRRWLLTISQWKSVRVHSAIRYGSLCMDCKIHVPGIRYLNNGEMVYGLALEIITATKPLSTRAIFKVLFQILPSCVGNLYYNILYVYWIKHIYFINVWFQNNHRQLNISACISNSAYLIP